MNKEIISDRQGISIVILFVMGTNLIAATAVAAKSDSWIAVILAVILSIPLMLIYARLHYLFPNKDIFDILNLVWGKIIAKLINLLFFWFALYLAGLVLRVLSEFMSIIALEKTPDFIPKIFLLILCVWISKEGIEVVGRWSEFFIIIFCMIIIVTVLLSVKLMNFNNLRPVMFEGVKPIIDATFLTLTFPFGQTVIFLMIFSCLETKVSSFKIYIRGTLIGGAFILITIIHRVTVLGGETMAYYFFPAYAAVRKITIGPSIQRLEIVVGVVFVIGVFIKVTTLLLASANGFAKLFDIEDYRFIVTPIALMIMNLSYLSYKNLIEQSEWTSKFWPYYSLPFEVILPLITLIRAEYKKKRILK